MITQWTFIYNSTTTIRLFPQVVINWWGDFLFLKVDSILIIYILESKIDSINQQSIESHMYNVCCHTDKDHWLENTLQQKKKGIKEFWHGTL